MKSRRRGVARARLLARRYGGSLGEIINKGIADASALGPSMRAATLARGGPIEGTTSAVAVVGAGQAAVCCASRKAKVACHEADGAARGE